METLGAASAATLGYIVGNLRGAAIGYNAYRSYMPTITRLRNRAGRRILSAMRGWRARGYPGGATERALSGMLSRNRSSRRRRRNNLVTRNKDYGTQYTKKRMPRGKRKNWKKFVKKVTAVQLSNASQKTVVYNSKIVSTSGAATQQYFTFALYGCNGNGDSNTNVGYRDLLVLFDNEPVIKQYAVGSPAAYYPGAGKLHFNSAVLDVTLRNLGEQDAEVDVYYGYHVKDAFQADTLGITTGSLRDEFVFAKSDGIKSGNTSVDLTARGTTPFDCSWALSHSGFHVLKKQKFLMEPGKSVFIQHRDSMNHVFEAEQLTRAGYAMKKVTYEVLVVHKPSVGSTDTLTSTIACGITRKYAYSVLAQTVAPSSAVNPTFDSGP